MASCWLSRPSRASSHRRVASRERCARRDLPMLIFVNKIDRLGARGETLVADIRRTLNLRVVAMNAVTGLGARTAKVATYDRADPRWRESVIDLLAETNEGVIEEFDRVGADVSDSFLARRSCGRRSPAGAVVPVFFGSAITGVGVPELLAGVEDGCRRPNAAKEAPVNGRVFKIMRRASGEKLVYARLFTGSLQVRQRVAMRNRNGFGEMEEVEERITGIDRFVSATATPTEAASAGDIVVLHGLRAARIGDPIGGDDARLREPDGAFPAPALESVVRPVDPGHITRLRAALEQLAEQDPLISLRQRNEEGEISLRLYGEVQKEVVMETLARDYGIGVTFGPTRTICIERPVGTGEYAEFIGAPENPFYATVGFRVEPAACGSGIRYVRELGALPLAFYRAIEETVHETFAQGLVRLGGHRQRRHPHPRGLLVAREYRRRFPQAHSARADAGTARRRYRGLRAGRRARARDPRGHLWRGLRGAAKCPRDDSERIREESSQSIICEIPTAELRAVEQSAAGSDARRRRLGVELRGVRSGDR